MFKLCTVFSTPLSMEHCTTFSPATYFCNATTNILYKRSCKKCFAFAFFCDKVNSSFFRNLDRAVVQNFLRTLDHNSNLNVIQILGACFLIRQYFDKIICCHTKDFDHIIFVVKSMAKHGSNLIQCSSALSMRHVLHASFAFRAVTKVSRNGNICSLIWGCIVATLVLENWTILGH